MPIRIRLCETANEKLQANVLLMLEMELPGSSIYSVYRNIVAVRMLRKEIKEHLNSFPFRNILFLSVNLV